MLNGGHGHADALSLVLNVGGTEILKDPGTCVYNGSPEWRDFFRSTHAHNTIVVDDASVSMVHAKITRKDGFFLVKDLNSTNGTFVNRMRIHPGQKRPLQVHDVIQIGTVRLEVRV